MRSVYAALCPPLAMNIRDLNSGSGIPASKKWLRPVAYELECAILITGGIANATRSPAQPLIVIDVDRVNVTANTFTQKNVSIATVDDVGVLTARIDALIARVHSLESLNANLAEWHGTLTSSNVA